EKTPERTEKRTTEGTLDRDKATPSDAAKARAETIERLKALPKATEKAESDTSKPLREILEERIRLLDEWDKQAAAIKEAEQPEVNPEREAKRLKAELESTRTLLERFAKDPSILLPEAFRKRSPRVTAAELSEMKEAIDEAQKDLDKEGDSESPRGDSPRKATSLLATLR